MKFALLLPLALVSCTPADRATAGTIIADVASAAPVVCAVLSAAGQPGSACGVVASDVSDVARLVQSILDGLVPSGLAAICPALTPHLSGSARPSGFSRTV